MKIYEQSNGYKVYLLLKEKPLTLEELKTLFNEQDYIRIIQSSFLIFINSEYNEIYLDNLFETYMNLFNESYNINKIASSLESIIKKAKKEDFLFKNTILPKLEEFSKVLITKIRNVNGKTDYDFISTLIYKIKSIPYLKQTINLTPRYVNTYNNGKHIVLEMIDKLLSYDDINNPNVTYFNSIILEFINSSSFSLSSEEIQEYCDLINKRIDELSFDSKDYTRKKSFYQGIINGLTNAEITSENIDLIKNKYGVSTTFSTNVMKQLESIPKEYIVAIDPVGCLDKDDAISIEKIDDHYHVKVYNADVPSVIRKDSTIDLEARSRQETLYLSDVEITLYPEEISHELLSLNTHSIKNVICYEFDLYSDGSVDNFSFRPTKAIINRSMSYDEANQILKSGGLTKQDETLLLLSEAAEILKRTSPDRTLYYEAKKIIHGNNRLLTQSESINEEFAILYQSLVANYYVTNGYPFIFRNHPTPDTTEEYEQLLRLKRRIEQDYTDKATYMKIADGLINLYPRAFYSLNNIGHFGLSKKAYAHCGSALRRYSDTTVQQLHYDFVFSKPTKEKEIYWVKRILEQCEYANQRIEDNLQFQREYERVKTFLK